VKVKFPTLSKERRMVGHPTVTRNDDETTIDANRIRNCAGSRNRSRARRGLGQRKCVARGRDRYRRRHWGGNVEEKKGIVTGLDAFTRYGMTNVVVVFPLLATTARSRAPQVESELLLMADS